jgi:hypothetical protein
MTHFIYSSGIEFDLELTFDEEKLIGSSNAQVIIVQLLSFLEFSILCQQSSYFYKICVCNFFCWSCCMLYEL